MVKLTSRVLVYTRVRPPTAKEAKEGLVVSVDSAEHAINLSDKNDREQHVFKCDGVFAPDAAQDAVFEEVGQPVLDATLEGYNGCVLAYGQTGSGKTHTLLNPGESVSDSGLVPRIAAALFFRIGQDLAHVLTVRVSFLQIYNEQIDDLLKPAGASVNLRLRTAPSGAIDVEGATSVRVSSPAALMQLFNQGRKNLVYAETRMNKSSWVPSGSPCGTWSPGGCSVWKRVTGERPFGGGSRRPMNSRPGPRPFRARRSSACRPTVLRTRSSRRCGNGSPTWPSTSTPSARSARGTWSYDRRGTTPTTW